MSTLPPIQEIYNFIQHNKDYSNPLKKYHAADKSTQPHKQAPTKKGHYLEDAVKMSTSPGPASTLILIISRHSQLPKCVGITYQNQVQVC